MRAAESLFAKHGIEVVAIRTICEAAGQRNSMSVHYHFGDRFGLLYAIFAEREYEIADRRNELLEHAIGLMGGGDVRSILRAIFEPYLLIYDREGNADLMKLIMLYLLHYRPLGIRHPVDDNCPNDSVGIARRLLKKRLYFLDDPFFDVRLDNACMLFHASLVQHADHYAASNISIERVWDDTLETMVGTMCALPPLSRDHLAPAGSSLAS